MRVQLIQLRCRTTVRGPADVCLDAAAARAEEPGKPNRHAAEQRRDLTKPPVFDVTSAAAGRAIRPESRVFAGLRGNHRLLNTSQKLLGLGQREPQIRDIAKVRGATDFHHFDTPCRAVSSRFDQPQRPPHSPSPGRQPARPVISLPSLSPQCRDTPANVLPIWPAVRI